MRPMQEVLAELPSVYDLKDHMRLLFQERSSRNDLKALAASSYYMTARWKGKDRSATHDAIVNHVRHECRST